MRYAAAFASLATLLTVGNAFTTSLSTIDVYGNVITSQELSVKMGEEAHYKIWLGVEKKHLAGI